jgi:hypothetical protein
MQRDQEIVSPRIPRSGPPTKPIKSAGSATTNKTRPMPQSLSFCSWLYKLVRSNLCLCLISSWNPRMLQFCCDPWTLVAFRCFFLENLYCFQAIHVTVKFNCLVIFLGISFYIGVLSFPRKFIQKTKVVFHFHIVTQCKIYFSVRVISSIQVLRK